MNEIKLTDQELEVLKAILFKITIDALHAKTLVSIQDKVMAIKVSSPVKKGENRNGHLH